jgi:hypothetical protein
VLAAYLIRYLKINVIEAMRLIRSKRDSAFTPRCNFFDALVAFEKWCCMRDD